ncbi:GerAB/ArcD/ProY family transporter [Ferdinandcohnia sp. Marseille-Q9671]
MKKENISGIQLFYLMTGFVLGTALILGVGGEVKQDAWLYTVVGVGSGLILMAIYSRLSTYYQGDTLVEMLPKIIGKSLSYPIIVLYLAHFTYSAARACRELGDLIGSTILTETPTIVIIGSFMVLTVYCLAGGLETLGRMSEIVFPIYFFSLILIWILLLTVEQFNMGNLTPILGQGVLPFLKKSIPNSINFPFGETIVIMMFFPFLANKKNVRKIGMFSVLLGGSLLALNSVMVISVIGPEIFNVNIFNFLAAVQMVSVADFLERFDAIVILMMVAGVFFKVGAFTLAATIGITQLCNVKQTRTIVLALATVITPLSLISATSYIEHLEIGFKYFIPYVHTLLQIIIPFLLLCIAIIRKKLEKKERSQ